jgi:hypothetical protein
MQLWSIFISFVDSPLVRKNAHIHNGKELVDYGILIEGPIFHLQPFLCEDQVCGNTLLDF